MSFELLLYYYRIILYIRIYVLIDKIMHDVDVSDAFVIISLKHIGASVVICSKILIVHLKG